MVIESKVQPFPRQLIKQYLDLDELSAIELDVCRINRLIAETFLYSESRQISHVFNRVLSKDEIDFINSLYLHQEKYNVLIEEPAYARSLIKISW